ncbi:tetratricopeptide repeat protein [Gimesia chilikensis]|uniref:tetratricopeptide repeat protein n=1 Tax=Gimesia chilikensis TaxID=2605989 RepID=UPI003A8FCA41
MASEVEIEDVTKVEAALEALTAGKLQQGERLLQEVVANTPETYENEEADGEGVAIKFWSMNEFMQYVSWMQDHGTERAVKWIGNAYPRAYYYLGFLCVKQQQYAQAIEYLDKGRSLEPENPKFLFEKAQALIHLGNKEGALALYDQVVETGPHVSQAELAMARRGRGFVLIEMGKLDDAEAAFHASLELDPESEIALSELKYIAHLRQGGPMVEDFESVETTGPDLSSCAICGKDYEQGVMITVEGRPLTICKRCERRLTKKWWQFWK